MGISKFRTNGQECSSSFSVGWPGWAAHWGIVIMVPLGLSSGRVRFPKGALPLLTGRVSLGASTSALGEEGWGLFAFSIQYGSIQPLNPFIFSMTPLLWSVPGIPSEILLHSPGRKLPSFCQVEGNAIALELGIQESISHRPSWIPYLSHLLHPKFQK